MTFIQSIDKIIAILRQYLGHSSYSFIVGLNLKTQVKHTVGPIWNTT